MPVPRIKRRFQFVLVKPSHYDADGYVVQWVRSSIPANSLACLYALAQDAAQRDVLGPDVAVDISAFDETNTRIRTKSIIDQFRRHGGFGMVGLVGVQSNQFPRALDIARPLRAAGIPVVIGGFHVSGCLAMLPGVQPDLQQALDLGISLFAGEGEDRRLDQVMQDAANGTLSPIYNHMNDLPALEGAPTPFLPPQVLRRTVDHYASFDAGRGCPFQCSFCTIINVQGRKSRYRTPDDIEEIVRANAKQGVTKFFVTDDNFARNRNWEPILDRLIDLRENQGFQIRLLLQVDTLCHRIPGFIEKAARAGCNAVFIGLENINPESLAGTKKRQNKIWEYREMLQAWRKQKVMTWAGYILGFPTDTPESIARDIEIIKKELPIDILEFFMLTPLPGSEDHKKLFLKGVPMDPDMNNYDLEHVCTGHAAMTKPQWEGAYRDAWARYYTDEHVDTVLRRARVSGISLSKVVNAMIVFSGATRIENVHPLQFGIVRRKSRTQRRHGLPIESPLIYYPRRAVEFVGNLYQWGTLVRRYLAIKKRVKTDPAAFHYVDEALTPIVAGTQDRFVEVFADKIPKTHGAPVRPEPMREVVAAE